jgi:metallophosphoesterase (TIGR00282 family)
MNILFIGDIFGSPGRDAVKRLLPELKRRYSADLVVANCENAAHGKGITDKTARELFSGGCDVLTGGNHIFRQRGSEGYIDAEPRIVRPINFPPGAPGRGLIIYKTRSGHPVGIVNACGRTFMGAHYDDPFRAIDGAVTELRRSTSLILVDFHAEATSEKVAMGWYLDGRVTAVLGTHTHIPTADERLLHNGTAYITDTGMTGPYNSVIGDNKEGILEAMRSQLPKKYEVSEDGEVALCGVFIKADEQTGRATHIERVRQELK